MEISSLVNMQKYLKSSMIVPNEVLASIPEDLRSIEAAPLMWAGVTTYNINGKSDSHGLHKIL